MADEKEKTLAEQLEEIEREEAEAAKAEKEADGRRRIERHKLVKRFEAELGGPEGREFYVCELFQGEHFEGFVVVKKAGAVLFKRLQASKMTDPDIEDFLAPHIAYPERDAYNKLITDLHGAKGELLKYASKLHGVKYEDTSKK